MVEGHVRSVIDDAENDGFEAKIYRDLLAGGFSVGKVTTDYINPLSFEQKIIIDRVFDPTMCGFDPMARTTHKGDGRFAFELIPKTKEEFEREYGKEAGKDISYTRSLGEFQWTYQTYIFSIFLWISLC